jgi:hypothetical protein
MSISKRVLYAVSLFLSSGVVVCRPKMTAWACCLRAEQYLLALVQQLQALARVRRSLSGRAQIVGIQGGEVSGRPSLLKSNTHLTGLILTASSLGEIA